MASKALFGTTTGGDVKDSDIMAYKEADTGDDGTRNQLFSVMQTYFQGTIPGTLAAYGTAVSSDVQTSLIDTTEDSLMKVGAFGLGGILFTSDGDNSELVNGMYVCLASDCSNPGGLTSSYGFLTSQRSSTSAIQTWQHISSAGTTSIYNRLYSASSWGDWVKVSTTYDYPSDDAWTTVTSLSNGWTGSVRYIKRAGAVYIEFENIVGTSATSSNILTLGSDYWPSLTARGSVKRNVSIDTNSLLTVTTAGVIEILSQANISAGYGSISFPVL